MALTMTSCSAVQVNERMFVQLMGISETDGLYELTVQVYNSTDSEDSDPQYKALSGSGRSRKRGTGSVGRR